MGAAKWRREGVAYLDGPSIDFIKESAKATVTAGVKVPVKALTTLVEYPMGHDRSLWVNARSQGVMTDMLSALMTSFEDHV